MYHDIMTSMKFYLLYYVYFGRHQLQDDAHGSYDVIPAMPVHKYNVNACTVSSASVGVATI